MNQPALDVDGTAYLNGEDGVLYAFDRSGHVIGQVFLDTALGAAYTPLSIGPGGIIYTQNNGVLFAVGAAPRAPRGASRSSGESGARDEGPRPRLNPSGAPRVAPRALIR